MLDTGFTGYGVVGKRWLSHYQKYMSEKHRYGWFKKVVDNDDQRFMFGSEQIKRSLAKVEIPIWVGDSFRLVNVHLITGNLELLLGRDFLYEFKIVIDSAATKIRIGEGKWIPAVDNGKGLICLPIAPDPKGDETNPMTKAKRQRERKKRFKANQLQQVNRVSHKEQICLDNDETNVYLTEIRNLKNLVNDLGQEIRNMGIQSVSNSNGTVSAVAQKDADL